MSLKGPKPPVALTIAGSDCSSGAGIQADLKTFTKLGVYGLTAITGVVAETPNKVLSWKSISPALLQDQLLCLLEEYPIAAIKTGALFDPELVNTVHEILSNHQIPLVIDPVGSASTGANLGGEALISSLERSLLRNATLITPNLAEAKVLSGLGTNDLTELAECLARKFQTNILVKGGHASGEEAHDILVTTDLKVTKFSLPRVQNADYHGTGCTLSAAITAELALGRPLVEAISNGKSFLHDAIKSAYHWEKTSALNTF